VRVLLRILTISTLFVDYRIQIAASVPPGGPIMGSNSPSYVDTGIVTSATETYDFNQQRSVNQPIATNMAYRNDTMPSSTGIHN
jgi:hypothetical protein